MTKPSAKNPNDGTTQGEPPLGPACGFFFLIGCVLLSMTLIISAWMLSRGQADRAASALQSQLIPWVEQSSLADPDKQSILERLNELVTDMKAKKLTDGQLSRLNFRLSSAPIFQWGVIEDIEAKASASQELSDSEKQTITRECNRLLQTVLDSKLGMEQLEFAVQKVATKEARSGRLSALEKIDLKDFQEFSRRISEINDRLGTSKTPLDKSVSQVFRIIVDSALQENPQN